VLIRIHRVTSKVQSSNQENHRFEFINAVKLAAACRCPRGVMRLDSVAISLSEASPSGAVRPAAAVFLISS
jgi:hypothetical protein